MANKSESVVLQMVRQNDEKHEAGHHRLRVDWREHEERLTSLEEWRKQQEISMATLKAAPPPDLSKTTLSWGVVVTVLCAVAGIVAGQVASTSGMRSDIRDISTRLNSQAAVDQSAQKLQDERANALRTVVDAIVKKQDLQQLEIQSLRETILNQRSKP